MQSGTTLLLRARVIIAGPKTDLPLLESIQGLTWYRKRSKAEDVFVGACGARLDSIRTEGVIALWTKSLSICVEVQGAMFLLSLLVSPPANEGASAEPEIEASDGLGRWLDNATPS
jgi:hypothetical protein